MALNEAGLLDYASLKFQEAKYDEALEAFVLAYMKGIEQQWVLETIYNCYVDGNKNEFQDTFQRYTQKANILFEECLLDFIPYRDGVYYIFDKEEHVFRGRFSTEELRNTVPNQVFQEAEFSATAWEMDWDWRKFQDILKEAENREMYVICHDMKRAVSFYQIPELVKYMDHVMLFPDEKKFQEYFHKDTKIYLPKVLIEDENSGRKLARVVEEEHLYRLTPDGRNDTNVLLTIGIPTHARGNLLLQRLELLQKLPYDSEVEIVISKNGISLYQEEYRQASEIPDTRIRYYDHGKELQPVENWHYVAEMARGRYVIFVSDEDDIEPSALEHYFRLLKSYPEVVMIRPRTNFQYSTIQKEFGKKGIDAFSHAFLRQNYLSGLIVRREDFIAENLLRLESYKENAFYHSYPHQWWCAFLAFRGDYMEEPVQLISENTAVRDTEIKELEKLGILKDDEGNAEDTGLPIYATYEERFNQFQGQLGLIHLIAKEDMQLAEEGLKIAIGKLGFLLELAYSYKYKLNSFPDVVDRYVILCMDAVDEFQLQEQQKLNIFILLKQWAINLLKLHEASIIEENTNS